MTGENLKRRTEVLHFPSLVFCGRFSSLIIYIGVASGKQITKQRDVINANEGSNFVNSMPGYAPLIKKTILIIADGRSYSVRPGKLINTSCSE